MGQPRVGGRPSKYRPIYPEQAEKLALLGATDEKVAAFFGVGKSSLYRWDHDYPEFREARARLLADGAVVASLYQRATGYSRKVIKVFPPAGTDMPVYARYTEYVPADVQAATWWLVSRCRVGRNARTSGGRADNRG
jgi:hypothetical protein